MSIDSVDRVSSLDFDQIVKLKDFIVLMLDYFAMILLKYVEEEYYLNSKVRAREYFESEQESVLGQKLAQMEEM